jgi:magnesium-transporting ATPase (P-type)
MGGATQITTDKTGTLTENRMTVVEAWYAQKQHDNVGALAKALVDDSRRRVLVRTIRSHQSFDSRKKKKEHIAVNSTAFISRVGGVKDLVGNKTECALLMLAEALESDPEAMRATLKPLIAHLYPFSSDAKTMGVVLSSNAAAAADSTPKKSKKSRKQKKKKAESLQREVDDEFTYFVKGASETVLAACSRVELDDGTTVDIDASKRKAIEKVSRNTSVLFGVVFLKKKQTNKNQLQAIVDMAGRGLRTLCLAYKRVPKCNSWEDNQPRNDLIMQIIV